ncbi:hypothetical protein DL98DRAFT_657513 [Cadophora sp. DSE1049]|nr:hypothetical protein DL98DRAFT_657513 [Cadophora sp. DSE1049]
MSWSQNRQRLNERLEDKNVGQTFPLHSSLNWIAPMYLKRHLSKTFHSTHPANNSPVQLKELIDLRSHLVRALRRATLEVDTALHKRLNKIPSHETKQKEAYEALQNQSRGFSNRITGADLRLPEKLALYSNSDDEIKRVRKEDLEGLFELSHEVVAMWEQKDNMHIFPGEGRAMGEGGNGDSGRELTPAEMAQKRVEKWNVRSAG